MNNKVINVFLSSLSVILIYDNYKKYNYVKNLENQLIKYKKYCDKS